MNSNQEVSVQNVSFHFSLNRFMAASARLVTGSMSLAFNCLTFNVLTVAPTGLVFLRGAVFMLKEYHVFKALL